MDCMRLFTKEDVLDGDEKPVSPPSMRARARIQETSLGKTCHQQIEPRSCRTWPVTFSPKSSVALLVVSFRHAVAAEPENDV